MFLFCLFLGSLFAQQGEWSEWEVVPPLEGELPVEPSEPLETEGEVSPFSGQATYTGFAVGQTVNPDDGAKSPGYGTVTIHADFDNNVLSGSFNDLGPADVTDDDFIDADGDGTKTMEELVALGAGMADVSKDPSDELPSLVISNDDVDWSNVTADLSALVPEEGTYSVDNFIDGSYQPETEIRGEMTGIFSGDNSDTLGGDWEASGYVDGYTPPVNLGDPGTYDPSSKDGDHSDSEKIGDVGGTYSTQT